MKWFQVLIGHEGSLRGALVQREPNDRTDRLVRGGFLAPLAPDEEVIPAQPGTYHLEDEPAKVAKRTRGKSAKAGQAAGEDAQPPVGVEVRDSGNGSHGGDGES